jgi:hypothetical protein
MTDPLNKAATKAGLELLRADLVLAAAGVHDGEVPNGSTRPYVLVYPWTNRPEDADSDALDGRSRTLLVRWICHCVGETRESAEAIAQRVQDALLDVTPVVPGWTVAAGLIKQESSAEPVLDKETGVAVYDARATYKCRITI